MAAGEDEAAVSRSAVEWSSSVRPLLAASYASFDARDIPQLVASIVKSKAQILHHDKLYEPFYSSFVALSAHYITSVCSQMPSSTLPGVGAACRVLIEFCLLRLEAPDEACAVSQKHLILLIKALCTGLSELDRTEVITFTAMMKSARLPLTIKTLSDAEEQRETASPPSVEEREWEVYENFYQQLSSPLSPDLSSVAGLGSPGTQERSAEGEELTSDPYVAARARAAFTTANVASLQELGGAEKLLRVCLNLPYFLRYINRFQDSVAAAAFFIMPATVADATAVRNGFHSLVIDVTMALDTLSLPILEPLTPSRLQGLTLLALSCLYAGVSVATCMSILQVGAGAQARGGSQSKEDDYETDASTIVHKCLEIYDTVGLAIRNSRRAGGENYQNFQLMGAWCLSNSLFIILHLSAAALADRGKEKDPLAALRPRDMASPRVAPGPGATATSPKVAPSKGHQGVGALAVVLANHLIGLLNSLLEDVRVEALDKEWTVCGPPAPLDVLAQCTAVQRVQRLMDSLPLCSLLFSLLATSYRKACALQRQRKGSLCSEGSASTDSNTYYEDDFSSSEDDSSQDEDSEPILGQWFEETISPSKDKGGGGGGGGAAPPPPPPPPPLESSPRARSPSKQGGTDGTNVHAASRNPELFLRLASSVLSFMTRCLVTTKNNFLRNYTSVSLTESHAATLASILRDVDRDAQRGHGWAAAEEEFTAALFHFSHSLVTAELLSPSLQMVLLSHLGVCPSAEGAWPLHVAPQTLALLARLLLLWQHNSLLQNEVDSAHCVTLWERFIDTLKNQALCAIQPQQQQPPQPAQPAPPTTPTTTTAKPPVAGTTSPAPTDTTTTTTATTTATPAGVAGAAVPSAPPPAAPAHPDDLNPEQAQLLLLLFHSLSERGSAALVLRCAAALVELAECAGGEGGGAGAEELGRVAPPGLARLVALLEYFLLHYSRPDVCLYEQVQANLLTPPACGRPSNANNREGARWPAWRHYHPFKEVEDNWLRLNENGSGPPRYYNLISPDNLTSDPLKVDTEVCRLLFADAAQYCRLYDACTQLLGAGSNLDSAAHGEHRKSSPLMFCQTRHGLHHTQAWTFWPSWTWNRQGSP